MRLYVAVDTDFLLAVARGVDSALAAVDIVTGQLHAYIVVPPCVLQELEDIIENDIEDAEMRQTAELALHQLDNWCFLSSPIETIDLCVADLFAKRLLTENLRSDYQSASVIAESSTLKARLLLSYSQQLDSDAAVRIKFTLIAADLTDCYVVDPRTLVAVFSESTAA